MPPSATPLPPTATPRPATPVPTTAVPTVAPTSPVIVPTSPPIPVETWSKLYFLSPNKTFYVPVTRRGDYTVQVARRAVEQMIVGPLAGSSLQRSIPAGMALRDISISGGTCYVDFDHSFEELGAGQREAMAVVLALTEFDTVQRVQFMVNGAPVGLPGSGNTDPVPRPLVNFENPYGLEHQDAVVLTLYFATADGQYLFPVTRYVTSTVGVARAAIDEMIKGPTAAYAGAAVSPLPAGTQVRDIYRDGDTIVVDFNSAFLNASNHALTVNALRLAMDDLTVDYDSGVSAVRISVEGTGLEVYWGSDYGGDLGRPILNPE
jgi:germination protein M